MDFQMIVSFRYVKVFYFPKKYILLLIESKDHLESRQILILMSYESNKYYT